MTDFAALLPDSIFTDTLGDDLIYHAKTGDLTIKGFISDYIDPLFAGPAQLQENRKRIDVAVDDAPLLKKGMKFTHNGTKYTVDAVVANDGHFAGCLVS